MRILDTNGKEIKNPDLSKGYLQDDKILIAHHPAVKYRAERAHWASELDPFTGRYRVIRIVDSKEIKAKPAWDEFEDIKRYVEYSTKELGLIAQYMDEESSMTRKELTERSKDSERALLDLAGVSSKNEEKIEVVSDDLSDHEAALSELGEMVDNTAESAQDNENALTDLAELTSQNEEKISSAQSGQSDNEAAILELGDMLSRALDKIDTLEAKLRALVNDKSTTANTSPDSDSSTSDVGA